MCLGPQCPLTPDTLGLAFSSTSPGCRHRGVPVKSWGAGVDNGAVRARQETTDGQERGAEPPTSASLVPSVPEPGPPEDPSSAQKSLYLAYSQWRTGNAKATLGPRTDSWRAEAARRRRGRVASPMPGGAAGLAPTGRAAYSSQSQPGAPGLTRTLFKVERKGRTLGALSYHLSQ